MKSKFTDWKKWGNRETLERLGYPGVYVIALSDIDIENSPFSWCSNVIYVGMSNAKGGLKSRLRQFDNSIQGRKGHGGGQRVRYKHRVYADLAPNLYVSVCPHACDVTSNKPEDLRIMGEVVRQEYECFAVFSEAFQRLPEFNDKKHSPKI